MAKKKFFDKKEEVKENKEMEEKEVNIEENKVEETVTEEVKEPETEVQTSTGDAISDEPSVEAPEIRTEEIEETKVGKLSNCELLNARKEPNKDSEVLFVIGKEDKIVILEEENDFYKVSVNNKEAYCMKNFIVVE